MAWGDKVDHINEREYRDYVNRLNPANYRKITQHKVVEKAMLSLLGFPTPRFLGYFHRLRGRTWLGRPLRTGDDLARLLNDCAEPRVIFKLVEGWGGAGVRVIENVPEQDRVMARDLASGDLLTPELLAAQLDSTDGYIVEAYIEQHETLAALNASSLNTVRIWFLRHGDAYRLAGAILRVGRQGALVDNISAGGYYCPIDLATGTLSAIHESHATAEPCEAHPETEAMVAGVRLPFWREANLLAMRALDAFPHMQFAGLDIAIAADGPRIIELNAMPDLLNGLDFDVSLRRYFDYRSGFLEYKPEPPLAK